VLQFPLQVVGEWSQLELRLLGHTEATR
jgi:hypothetical protein